MMGRTVRTLLALTDVSCAVAVASGEQLTVSAAQVHQQASLISCAFVVGVADMRRLSSLLLRCERVPGVQSVQSALSEHDW